MKRLIKSVQASSNISVSSEDKYVFTPLEILDLLMQIKELRSYGINVSEVMEGVLQFIIGDSIYEIRF